LSLWIQSHHPVIERGVLSGSGTRITPGMREKRRVRLFFPSIANQDSTRRERFAGIGSYPPGVSG